MAYKFFIPIVIIYFLFACNRKENIVAQVYKETLSIGELQELVPHYDTQQDSVFIEKAHINRWIEEQVLIHEAKQNLTNRERDFSKELKTYENALLIHAYENKYIKEHKDEIFVSQEEINQYYQLHLNKYLLQQPVIKINYVKFPINFAQIENAKKIFFKERTAQEETKMVEYCKNYAINSYFQNNWLFFNDITKEVPINTYNQADFLAQKRTMEITDSNAIYLVKVVDFKIKEEYAPLSLVSNQIQEVLLEQKKVKLLVNHRQNLVQTAMKSGEISIEK